MAKDNLTNKAAKSVFWNMFSSVGVSGIRFISTAILARILFPEDFGLIGMAFVITGIVGLLGNLGLGQALVQRQKFDDESLSTNFWSEQVVGLFLALFCVVIAPFAAQFYQEDAVRFIVMSLSVNFIFASLAGTHSILLYKDLRFKDLAKVELICTVFRVSIVLSLAFMGMGFWSILWGIIGERALKTILFYVIVPWRPRWMFSRAFFGELFGFGKHVYGQSFVNYFNGNLDYLVTGRLLGADQLGYYQMAYNLPQLILELITRKISDVLFPLFSKVQDDQARLTRGFYKAVLLQSLITFPLLFGLMMESRFFILAAYSDRWELAIVPLQILCLGSIMGSVSWLNSVFLNAIGRPDINFKISLVVLPILIVLIWIFSRWGIIGVAWAMTLSKLVNLIKIYYCLRSLKETFTRYTQQVLPALASCLMMLLGLWGANHFSEMYIQHPLMSLIINVPLGAVIYILSVRIFFRPAFEEAWAFVGHFFNKSSKTI